MSSAEIATIVKMIESMPEPAQQRVIDHLREYIEELQDETRWDSLVEKTQPKLIKAARHARQSR
ncbi:MAG TPA: hypothetical protein VJ436_05380 [Anaerolineales bacterium]|nr:hypothetical protein [Anaerolineales bacterium]